MSPQRRRPSDVQFPTLPPAVEVINTGAEQNDAAALPSESSGRPVTATITGAETSTLASDPTTATKRVAEEQPAPSRKQARSNDRGSRFPEPGVDEDANAKVATTLQLRAWIRQRAQTAVLRTAGMEGGYTSMQAFVEGAMLRELDRLQREFNRGEPYPPNRQGFRTGRPLGSSGSVRG